MDKAQAISTILDIVENNPEETEDAAALIALLVDDGRPPEGCLNHTPDSWGCCENCGCMVF